MQSHISELRMRIIRIMLVSTVLFFAVWGSSDYIIRLILSITPMQTLTVTPFESMTSRFLITGYLVILAVFPYTVYEGYCFISPGLYEKEKVVLKTGIPIMYCSYMLGAIIPAYLLSKFILSTLSGYVIAGVSGTISLQSLISFVLTMSIITGVIFCIPAISGGLSYLGILNAETMKKYRKHFVIFACVFSAIVTPPDIISMAVMTLPMVGLFEISILLSKVIERTRNKK
ncbi:Twin-arginine translocation protein TatC [Methanosarcina horonobensis HB-1 = JCM 15518]|uniref:Sec-independent protein translocase protein TatC n=1 Tax=Methanosarcina horonobensis HB-1 = JCM 15518 TaxID=1434110 RepID=A0A0E3SEM2_9EURY|nr:Twin-arginine translocation protein TatC [Methanosarcina horonobensis HB-1 = JCM 15518]